MKKGIDVMLAIGKPKGMLPPRPKSMGMDEAAPADDAQQEDDDLDQKTYDCVKRTESLIEKIADALGIDTQAHEDSEPADYEKDEER